MATIGRSKAVAQIGRWRLAGRPAWWVWLFVHILFLVGFRNRFVVLFEWSWAYVTYQRSARIILENPIATTAPGLPAPATDQQPQPVQGAQSGDQMQP